MAVDTTSGLMDESTDFEGLKAQLERVGSHDARD